MKKGKNFFYRINPNEVLAEAIFAEDKEGWFLQFFRDLINDDPNAAKFKISADIIREAHEFRAKRSMAGKASAEQKTKNKQQKRTYAEQVSSGVATNGQQTSTSSSSSNKKTKPKGEYSVEFLSFWDHYPRKEKKKKAFEAWQQIPNVDALLEKMLSTLSWQSESDQWTKEAGQFIPHPATWLNNSRWEDEQPKGEASCQNKQPIWL